MCAICGCGGEHIEGADRPHPHRHDHDHHNVNDIRARHDHGREAAGMHVPDLGQHRTIHIERSILAKNDEYAAANRARLAEAGVLAINLMSSPGSGKTTLLVRTIADLGDRYPIAVIEGDQQTSNDAERVRAAGVSAIQVNTGRGCHLDAHMIAHALDALPLSAGGLLFIENVGNLVCPAAFDLGEAHRVVVFSVTEGEDKPIKYPDMFATADLMLINKTDLIPYLDFDLARTLEYARRVNPRVEVFVVSARTGEGMPGLYAWIARWAETASAGAKAAGSL